jgi:hypothetical protein
MIKDWSLKDIKTEISKISWAESDPRMDGFVTWGCKQELYEILWYVEEKLRKCSTYAGEDDFLKEHDKEMTWRILNED